MSKAVIYKFPFEESTSTFLMPVDAKPIKASLQGRQLCIWALLDPDAPVVERRFAVYGTGQPIHDAECHVHIDTFFDDLFVFHVFEVTK